MSNRLPRIAVVALTAVMLGVFVLFLAYRLAVPWDGVRNAAELRLDEMPVTVLQSYPNGLRDGDVVVAVDDITLETWAEDTFARELPRPDWEVGGTADYTVLRDGAELRIDQPLVQYSLVQTMAAGWGALLFTFGNLLVALFAFSRRPDEPALQVYLIFASALVFSSTYGFGFQVYDIVGGLGLVISGLNVLLYGLIPAMIIHFLLVFPKPQPWLADRRWLIALLYIVPLAATLTVAVVSRPFVASTADWFDVFMGVGGVPLIVYSFLVPVAAIVTWRTARDPVSRAQIRWVVFAIAIAAAGGIITDTVPSALGREPLGGQVFDLLLLVIPISVVISIFRYRLFDIDVIIRRTTQYAIVTGLLVLIYFGAIVVLQRLFTTLTGQTSTVAVVLSTLLIAALFFPIRRRVQDVIDRRFFRRKYDAEKVLNDFAATVRDETDLDALTAELVRVIQDTMQPEFVSVWLRPESLVSNDTAVEIAERGRNGLASEAGLSRELYDKSARAG